MVSKAASRTRTKKTISGLLLAAVVSIGFTVVPVAPALADGCSSGQASFGCGSAAAPPPAGGSSTGSAPASPPAPPAGGGGTILPATQTVDRRVPDPANNCPVRDDGKAPLGADYIFDTQWASNTNGPSSPPNGNPSWIYQYSTPNGQYFFQRTVFLHRNCLYPPRTYFTTEQCIISSSATISLLRSATFSGVRVIKQASAMSGYAQGSTDYNSCVNSSARVDPRASLTEYGYYAATAVSQAQTALVEVAFTPNEVTGVVPAPKIVSLSGVYNLTPVSTSGSLECTKPYFFTPGNIAADFTETPCSDQNTNSGGASYQCVQGQPLFDSTVGPHETLIPFPANNTIQGLKDGNPQHIQFSQKPTGEFITVNSYDTYFTRDASSTPWKAGVGPQGNVFTLNTAKTGILGHNILTNYDGTKSSFVSGEVNDVWATAIDAGTGAPTKITQVLQWTGTRTVNSVEITSIDVLTGQFTYTTKQVQVPTTGECKQTVNINYVRSIGDVVMDR